jgi:UDP-N-acetylmuramate-alanine ligase
MPEDFVIDDYGHHPRDRATLQTAKSLRAPDGGGVPAPVIPVHDLFGEFCAFHQADLLLVTRSSRGRTGARRLGKAARGGSRLARSSPRAVKAWEAFSVVKSELRRAIWR